MKFGKYIQRKQLEIPEYASSFVDYKALKKLIKSLKSSPETRPGEHGVISDPQAALQANKAPFFFRLDRELDKVNSFYTVKEADAKIRIRTLVDKLRSMRVRIPNISKNSSHYITLEQGFNDFIKDVGKLEMFMQLNATAFSKILKKWDKTSKTSMKAQYLSRAYEVQPAFNHVMIGELGDEARIALLDCAQWAEGESTLQGAGANTQQVLQTPRLEQDDTDSDILDALTKGNVDALVGLIDRLKASHHPEERLSKAYLTAVSSAPDDALKVVLDTNMVDFRNKDEINDRNCLHKTAMAGRPYFLKLALANGVDPTIHDAYGRISLHYACMNGHVDLINDLVQARPETIETADLDGFTPLLHAITHNHLACVERLLAYSACVDRTRDGSHIPLNLACQYGSVQIVQLLLSKNPVVMPDVEGLYPQHLVARFGRDPRLLLMLRDYGASLDQPDKYLEWTPLFHAANDGRVECLQRLLELGVNAAAKDEKDLTAQYYAIWEGHLECMSMLAEAVRSIPVQKPSSGLLPMQAKEPAVDFEGDIDAIPDLALPPPYMPSRQYGHNFLDAKTTVLISFNDSQGVTFYDASKYPAARLTISPKSADIVPRNILLPIQDENRHVHFEMDDLTAFSVDFDVFPTFGKRVIAKGSVPSKVFHNTQSSFGHYNLSLFDPRLRSVGEIYFKFQVIRPFSGIPLEITPYATYWKATSQPESKTNPQDMQVTVSSLSGEYVRLYVQVSRDGVPILCPQWTVQETQGGSDIPIAGLTYDSFVNAGAKMYGTDHTSKMLSSASTAESPAIHKALAASHASLEAVLAALPAHIHVELHVLYPDSKDEAALHLGPSLNINAFVDNILRVIFEHARSIRKAAGSASRGIVFTSYNKDLCTALNLKQPNFPVLLCNDLGAPQTTISRSSDIVSSGKSSMSIKDAVRVAQSNNFMGLICRSQILDMVPALIKAIETAGLVLVSDASVGNGPRLESLPKGVTGMLLQNGIMKFNEVTEM